MTTNNTNIVRKHNDHITYRNRIVGEHYKRLFRTIRQPQHYMIKYQGFGVSLDVLEWLRDNGCEYVLIEYQEKTQVTFYKAHIGLFLASNKTYTFEDDDVQKFLSTKEMERIP